MQPEILGELFAGLWEHVSPLCFIRTEIRMICFDYLRPSQHFFQSCQVVVVS